jgi:hypothetical protein
VRFGEACALQVLRIGVRVRGAVAAAWWGTGLELEPGFDTAIARSSGDGHRAHLASSPTSRRLTAALGPS